MTRRLQSKFGLTSYDVLLSFHFEALQALVCIGRGSTLSLAWLNILCIFFSLHMYEHNLPSGWLFGRLFFEWDGLHWRSGALGALLCVVYGL